MTTIVKISPTYTVLSGAATQRECERADRSNISAFKQAVERCNKASKLLGNMCDLTFEVVPPEQTNVIRHLSQQAHRVQLSERTNTGRFERQSTVVHDHRGTKRTDRTVEVVSPASARPECAHAELVQPNPSAPPGPWIQQPTNRQEVPPPYGGGTVWGFQ